MMKQLKHQRNKVLAATLFLLNAGLAQGQTSVKVTLVDNSEIIYSVEADGKLSFNIWSSSSSLLIKEDNSGLVDTLALADIRKITFDENSNPTAISESAAQTQNISIFPNPANDYFDLFASDAAKLNVRIFNTTGAQVASGVYENGKRVNISHLNAGIYVVVINNQSFKLVKQ